jgi:hypothetical protein
LGYWRREPQRQELGKAGQCEEKRPRWYNQGRDFKNNQPTKEGHTCLLSSNDTLSSIDLFSSSLFSLLFIQL